MAVMTHAKFHFNRLMVALIFGIQASEIPPPPPPQARRTTEKVGSDRVKITPTTFWLKCKNLPKCTKFASARKLEVAAKNFGLLTKTVSCIGKYGA